MKAVLPYHQKGDLGEKEGWPLTGQDFRNPGHITPQRYNFNPFASELALANMISLKFKKQVKLRTLVNPKFHFKD